MTLSANDYSLVCGSVSGIVSIFAVPTLKTLRVFDLTPYGSVSDLSFTHGNRITSCNINFEVV